MSVISKPHQHLGMRSPHIAPGAKDAKVALPSRPPCIPLESRPNIPPIVLHLQEIPRTTHRGQTTDAPLHPHKDASVVPAAAIVPADLHSTIKSAETHHNHNPPTNLPLFKSALFPPSSSKFQIPQSEHGGVMSGGRPPTEPHRRQEKGGEGGGRTILTCTYLSICRRES